MLKPVAQSGTPEASRKLEPRNLRNAALTGVGWSATQTWGVHLVGFTAFLALSHLLGPEAFGLLAIAGVYTAVIDPIIDLGMGDAIVQRSELDSVHLNTAFWTNLAAGIVLTLVSGTLSSWLAILFNDPRLMHVVAWLALSFVFLAAGGVHRAILRRRLKFKTLAACSLIAALAGGVVGVVMAVRGFEYWSLVGQILTNTGVEGVLLWITSDWHPGTAVSRHHFKDLFSFGRNIIGARLLNVFNRRVDDLFIGLFLGPVALGYYTIGYKILLILTQLLTGITTAVALPLFSKLQHNRTAMRQAFYSATRVTSLVAFPAFLGVAVLAPELIQALFGKQWTPSAPVLRVLAGIGMLHSVFYFNSAVMTAAGKPSWRVGLTLVNAIGNVIAFAIAVQWGIVAVAVAYVIRGYLLSPLPLSLLRRLIDLDLGRYVKQYIPPLVCSLAMSAAVLVLKSAFTRGLTPGFGLALLIPTGVVVYTAVLYRMTPTILADGMDYLRLIRPHLRWHRR